MPKAKANIEAQESNAILTITLSRPERLNILDMETRKEILRVLESYESSPEIRCLLLTARGEVFSAGADIRYLLSLDNKTSREYAGFVRSFLTYVESYPKPVVGAVNGTAVGGGLELLSKVLPFTVKVTLLTGVSQTQIVTMMSSQLVLTTL